jgi:putative transposase
MKSGRVEHLLRGRFHIEPVCVVEYLLTVLRYIHQNQVKAGIAPDCGSYPWSSYHDYMNPGKAAHILTDTALPLDIIRGWQKFA